MNSVTATLTKVLSKEFYRHNTGFFLLTGTLTFGFMSEVEHRALAESIVSTPRLLLIPIGVWWLYGIKVLNFNLQQLSRIENQVLFNIPFLPVLEQARSVSIFLLWQLLPAIVYGIYLLTFAWSMPLNQSWISISLSLVLLWSGSAFIMIRQLHNPHREKSVSFLKRFTDYQYPKPIIQIYVAWLLRRDPFMLAGSKIFAGLLIIGICSLYDAEYDGRLISMTMTVVAMATIPIAFHIQNFENLHVSWIKNLPVGPIRRYVWYLLVLILLLLPEIVVLFKNFPPHLRFYVLIANILYAVSLGACFFGLLHIEGTTLEKFTKVSFVIFISLIILILFKIPLLILTGINFATGFLIYHKYFYLFEPASEGTT